MPQLRSLPRILPLGLVLALVLVSCSALPAAETGGDPPAEPAAERETVLEPGEIHIPPPLPTDRPLRAGFLVVDGVYGTELVAPWDVLEHTRVHVREGQGPGIEVFTVSPDGRPVTTAEGLEIGADHGFGDHPPIDLLVVPSADGSLDADLDDRAMLDWVAKTAAEARYTMSLCWGAFVLAEAGVLDGRAATTFPGDYELFAERYPEIETHVNLSFVHDGPVLTSQGGVKSFEAAMYLVDLLYGPDVARGIGGGLLVPWPPDLRHGPNFLTRRHAPPPPAEAPAGESIETPERTDG